VPRTPAANARLPAILALGVLLAGCLGFGGGKAVESVLVSRGEVGVAGPRGYCIDTAASRDSSGGAFVLLGSCAALSGNPRAPHPDRPAVLTAAVSGPGDGPGMAEVLEQLPDFMRSDAGRASLSRAGDPDSITVHSVRTRNSALWLHVRDTAGHKALGVEPDYWRAVFDLGARIVTLSVMVPTGQSLSPGGAEATLEQFLRRMREVNPPDRGAVVASSPAVPE